MRALRQLRSERAFTLIEAQLVMVIMGILGTSAGPSVFDFMDQAMKSAAASNVQTAVPAAEAYYMDHGTYWGMSAEELLVYDPVLKVETDQAQDVQTGYCIYSTVGKFTFYKRGPGGPVVEDPTPNATPCA